MSLFSLGAEITVADLASRTCTRAEITDYAKSSGVPLAVVQAGCYDSNFLTMMAPKKNEDGSYAFYTPVSPKTVYSLVDTQEDYGAYVRAAIEKYGAGSETLACAEEITMEEIAKIWSEGESHPCDLLLSIEPTD